MKRLRSLMGAFSFNNPKDHTELIQRLFDYVCSGARSDDIVVDFFAGSADFVVTCSLRLHNAE